MPLSPAGSWDYETLRACFPAGADVLETELLRRFFPDAFDDGLSLNLFQKHFLLYRRLWLFDDELRLASGERLWIHGIRSTLLAPPPVDTCGHLDEESGAYCSRVGCGHEGNVPVSSLKSYYLDWRNLEGMTEEGLKRLVDGFFRWMGDGKTAEALAEFGLEPGASPRAIQDRWRRLSLEHHPDRGGDLERYQSLSAAWAVLKRLV